MAIPGVADIIMTQVRRERDDAERRRQQVLSLVGLIAQHGQRNKAQAQRQSEFDRSMALRSGQFGQGMALDRERLAETKAQNQAQAEVRDQDARTRGLNAQTANTKANTASRELLGKQVGGATTSAGKAIHAVLKVLADAKKNATAANAKKLDRAASMLKTFGGYTTDGKKIPFPGVSEEEEGSLMRKALGLPAKAAKASKSGLTSVKEDLIKAIVEARAAGDQEEVLRLGKIFTPIYKEHLAQKGLDRPPKAQAKPAPKAAKTDKGGFKSKAEVEKAALKAMKAGNRAEAARLYKLYKEWK